MGNCCGSESSTVWATLDEWEWEEDSVPLPRKDPVMEKEYGAGDHSKEQLKLTITKNELTELLGNARLQGVPVDRILSRLIASDAVDLSHVQSQRSWSPTLHSIAE